MKQTKIGKNLKLKKIIEDIELIRFVTSVPLFCLISYVFDLQGVFLLLNFFLGYIYVSLDFTVLWSKILYKIRGE